MSDHFSCTECRWFGCPRREVKDNGDGTATVTITCPECGEVLLDYSTTSEEVREKSK